uniref:Uncharacterized protein n=1 Tax=Mycolicibacterium neoaurum VKM Ac-1815D TaxID=700508 RepID=V5XJP2_MYCNE
MGYCNMHIWFIAGAIRTYPKTWFISRQLLAPGASRQI